MKTAAPFATTAPCRAGQIPRVEWGLRPCDSLFLSLNPVSTLNVMGGGGINVRVYRKYLCQKLWFSVHNHHNENIEN
jgi:hypothetical protein